jgi:response regulator of citrate/malate metabolism
MVRLFRKNKNREANENISKQLGVQYVQIFKILERMKELDQKIKENQSLLKELNRKYVQVLEKKRMLPLKIKTKEAIKLILKKYDKLTSGQLSKIIHLSRTRCSEYLKELEREKKVISETRNRKKYYKLRR